MKATPSQGRDFLPHILVILTAALMWVFNDLSPAGYEASMQEDRFVEWLTFFLFLVAGAIGVYKAARSYRTFDFLVGAFCLFVAGEEISWGQRIFGLVPSEEFLRSNYQQELNVHNMAAMFGQPKWTLIAVLLAYGVLVPAAFRIKSLRPAYKTLGVTVPPDRFIPLFALLALLLYWYPLPYTSEWVEMLSGALFLLAPTGGAMSGWALMLAATPVAIAASFASSFSDADPASLACARNETRALLDAMVDEQGLRLPETHKYERRVWTAISEGVVDSRKLAKFQNMRCGNSSARREQFAVDPWGTSYWLQIIRTDEGNTITVYSFGPNRRRDEVIKSGDWSDDISFQKLQH